MAEKRNGCLQTVIVVAALVVIGLAWNFGAKILNDPKPTEDGATKVCQQYVTNKTGGDDFTLDVPDVTHDGKTWSVLGFEGAQDIQGTGANALYACTARWLGDGKWDVTADITER